jgi:hypothetical protein
MGISGLRTLPSPPLLDQNRRGAIELLGQFGIALLRNTGQVRVFGLMSANSSGVNVKRRDGVAGGGLGCESKDELRCGESPIVSRQNL